MAPIDVFADVTADRIEVFVRDRGPGFDLDAVPEERRGVRDSIVGRMERAGGRAVVRTGWGAGTEVKLSLARGGG
jgi:signal transduction histidine kinase